jgi:uncharacterized Zn finger protein
MEINALKCPECGGEMSVLVLGEETTIECPECGYVVPKDEVEERQPDEQPGPDPEGGDGP